jgi:hypothetical protein
MDAGLLSTNAKQGNRYRHETTIVNNVLAVFSGNRCGLRVRGEAAHEGKVRRVRWVKWVRPMRPRAAIAFVAAVMLGAAITAGLSSTAGAQTSSGTARAQATSSHTPAASGELDCNG